RHHGGELRPGARLGAGAPRRGHPLQGGRRLPDGQRRRRPGCAGGDLGPREGPGAGEADPGGGERRPGGTGAPRIGTDAPRVARPRPPHAVSRSRAKPHAGRPASHLMRSLRFFRARARTVLRAGLALKVVFCLVIGWMPSRALVAGLWTFFSFSRPGMVKTPGPFLPSCALIRSVSASKTATTCFLLSWVLVETSCTTAALVIALPAPPDFLLSAIGFPRTKAPGTERHETTCSGG